MTITPKEAAGLLAAHGLSPSRALGQNFVVDPNTVRRIARLAGVGEGDHVVEIGAGLGSLTLALAETGASVTAVEVDRHLVPVLRAVLDERAPGVRLVEADATTLDWAALLADAPRWVLVANLPYNVATPLVLDILDDVPAVERLLVMVQKEAGERLAAGPGDDAYGIPSVKVRYHATASLVGTVSPNVFIPKPRVDSALVSIVRRPAGPVVGADVDVARMFALVRAGFGQRRKMLRRSLAGLVDAAAFETAEVAPTARAEDLDIDDWARLAHVPPPTPANLHRDRVPYGHGVVERFIAPAKVTLSLRVTGVRADGLHLIDAEMVTVDLADELVIDAEGDGLEVRDEVGRGLPVVADASNLVNRALALVRRRAGVVLTKRIPAGGGLGGGSADAAAVLRWAGYDDPVGAAGLGADVAFCLRGGRARVTGVGEVLEPLPFEARTLTLLTPPFGCSTPAVYRAWDDLGGPRASGPNDLEPAALVVEPRLAEWRDRLASSTGATPVLAGSGSTWFVEGGYPDVEGAVVVRTVPSTP